MLGEQSIFNLEEYFVFTAVDVFVSCVTSAAKWLCDIRLNPYGSLPTQNILW